VVFIDDLGRQLFHVDNVFIALYHGSNQQRLSPGDFDPGQFMFGIMLDLTTPPLTQSNATIWRRVPVYITPSADNRAINIIAPPLDMLRFTIGGAIGRPLLVEARVKVMGTAGGDGPHSYYLYGYIGNLLYSFKFNLHRTVNNVILADPVHGSLHIKVEGIL
jgi:hypothetical protein